MSLDARVLLHDPAVDALDLPQPSIRPYPHQRLGGLEKLGPGVTVSLSFFRRSNKSLVVLWSCDLVAFFGSFSAEKKDFEIFDTLFLFFAQSDNSAFHRLFFLVLPVPFGQPLAMPPW